jgi:hypothetical protein
MDGDRLPRCARPYLRFVVGADFDRPRRLAGPFQSAHCPDDEDDDSVPEWFRVELTEAHAWFQQHLTVPPFDTHRRWWAAVCWFRSDAGEPLARMWELARLLRAMDVPVRLLRTHKPGHVLWSDAHQIVADSRRRAR